jgi:hypothetical protein
MTHDEFERASIATGFKIEPDGETRTRASFVARSGLTMALSFVHGDEATNGIRRRNLAWSMGRSIEMHGILA